ncbi:MAG: glycine cleavage system aminomethyltransferase GcvT [Candidatus Acetothermia bacterium]|jgi:glycine hydroxymethyltransferase|nr:glycine cleavage system aminomethyltransferase GcvT [Candidatus Acetothermia bacterium]MDH7505680.1 glycine cleavage system aminomethyltransferase GcvT [Candidatus Acetothermia bacterium]
MYERYFNRPLAEVDPLIAALIGHEEERQARKIILIPSEAMAPSLVREALGSVFTNLYAEGYPPVRMVRSDERLLSDLACQLAHLRRYGDRRFYKGVEYVDILEALAQRRIAECFANPRAPADEIFVNIQPLSGAAANLAVYDAFLEHGDVVMGMDLMHGGHLTHGSRFNFSGKCYKVVSYTVDPKTELLDYDQIMELAREHKPKLIIAGYTSYPWAPDWERFRKIADEVGAILLADIAHTAGMAIAGAYPNPVGIADVVTFTTHKTICGPRGACILTTDEAKAEKIDNAVFPGEQGGPHVNKFAAMAVAFGIAKTEAFRELQHRIVANAKHLAEALKNRGIRLAYGGTNTHIVMVDLKSVHPELKGEPAARILDLAGIVVNRNTIPGDTVTALGTGIRLGTPWVSQRGMGKEEMEKLAELIHRIISNIKPFSYQGLRGELPRGKIELEVLEEVKREVEELAAATPAETRSRGTGYPHYYFLEEARAVTREHAPASAGNPKPALLDELTILQVRGARALPFLQEALTADIAALRPGECTPSFILERDGRVMDELLVLRLEPERFILFSRPENAPRVKAWLRGLSDGYIIFDDDDLLRKVEGPAVVEDLATDLPEEERQALLSRIERALRAAGAGVDPRRRALEVAPDGDRPQAADLYRDERYRPLFRLSKPYFVGQASLERFAPRVKKKEFKWEGHEPGPLRRTPLFEEHKRLGAKFVPFAGWEMPVWYSSVSEEHLAVREAAGLFDVGHMGVLEVAGEHATSLLDLATTNYVRWLEPGESQYTYLLDPDGRVIDDLIVYCRDRERYLLVVNAINAEEDLAWLLAVNSGEYLLDRRRPWVEPEGPALVRDLKAPEAGEDRRIDLALQGPKSLAILQRLAEPELSHRLGRLKRTELLEGELAGIPVIIARTGYTGEEFGYELLVHPDRAVALWRLLLEAGAEFGLKPAGLGARDSTRTEAGLPLYGHELAGELGISPIEAGFEGYVKFHKPFFIGREALLKRKREMKMTVVRFRMERKGVRPPKYGDPVVDRTGRFLGQVTSCALDTEGFLVGMAYIDKGASAEGTPLWIYSLPERGAEKGPRGLRPGDRLPLPNEAKVIPRFHIGRPLALHTACQE